MTSRRVIGVGLMALLAVLGFDLFLHGGLLARLYVSETPFLLPAAEAFRRIPLGYLSFAILIVLLEWLVIRLRIVGAAGGFAFGVKLGGLIWGALALGLVSISSARPLLLLWWAIGQSVELGIAGAVVASGLHTDRMRRLVVNVLIIFVVCVAAGIVLQNLLV